MPVLNNNMASDGFTAKLTDEKCDYISAIAIMFHITDDKQWENAATHLARVRKDEGVMLIGGEFSEKAQKVHFSKVDNFDN